MGRVWSRGGPTKLVSVPRRRRTKTGRSGLPRPRLVVCAEAWGGGVAERRGELALPRSRTQDFAEPPPEISCGGGSAAGH
ncbi:hypothetical protein NDU88_002315 [Pleurodeles waltl]|uniref:Uncharacterized protein n=1 Tax=Pleurodeles waltl TaxID=8319 RepID=A0AAV7NDM4_PLEWA|nr:hypothetical protein NDU88_002315 [Pleurodeles waltl]